MPDFSGWGKYLKHPLVLVGLALLLMNKLTSQYYSDQLKWILVVLCVAVILVGLLLATMGKGKAVKPGDKIKQSSKGNQSPNLVSGGDVNISYGQSSSGKDEAGK